MRAPLIITYRNTFCTQSRFGPLKKFSLGKEVWNNFSLLQSPELFN